MNTPTPWKYIDGEIISLNGDIVISDEWHGRMEAFTKEEDALFVVKACNAYHKLIEALKYYTYLENGKLKLDCGKAYEILKEEKML